jgi:hypothetical protein
MRYVAAALPFLFVGVGLGALTFYAMTYDERYSEPPYERPPRQCYTSDVKRHEVSFNESGQPIVAWFSADQTGATYMIFRQRLPAGRWEYIGNAPRATPGEPIFFTGKQPAARGEFVYGVQTTYCEKLVDGKYVAEP